MIPAPSASAVVADFDAPACLRSVAGEVLDLPVERWLERPSSAECRVLDRVVGPTLDVGCGPGRHVLALMQSGIVTLGIDVSPPAVELARRRGVPALHRSVFDRIPGAGRWGTALLLDGNVGIGGDPVVLLCRVMSLLRPGGRLLVEVAPPGTTVPSQTVRFEICGQPGPWFRWAHVAADQLAEIASRSGMRERECWHDDGRWFARIER